MREFTAADNAHNPYKATAYAAHDEGSTPDTLTYLSSFLQGTESEEESALGAWDSDSSIETKMSTKSSSHSKAAERNGRGKSRDRATKSVNGKCQDNRCKHSRKYKRKNQHPNFTADQCFWNKKKDRWRPKFVCEEMEVKSKPRHLFEDK